MIIRRGKRKTGMNKVIKSFLILGFLFTISCATLPKDFEQPESYAYTDTEDTRLGRARHEEKLAHPGESGFLLLENGLDAFVARAVLAQAADRSIDAQYFLIKKDLISRLFVDQLLKAADRGVRVRLLVDDVYFGGKDLGAAVMDSHPNVEVRLFNPFSRRTFRFIQFLTRFGSVTRRMHNKSFTVDNQVTILGGRNIADEYFQAHPELAFGDLDVLAIGPVVRDVSDSFDLYWNSEWSYPISVLKRKSPTAEEIDRKKKGLNEFVAEQKDSTYLQALWNSNLANAIRKGEVHYQWGGAEVIYDQPEKIVHDFSKEEFHMVPKLRSYVEDVQEELIIFSPYFVPGKKGVAFLKQLSERGVRVRILTNSLASTNLSIVHAGYAKYRGELLSAGIELYEVNKKYGKEERKEKEQQYGLSQTVLHAKAFVLDREQVFIGSLNLDPRAFYHNTEIGVVLTSSEVAHEMGDWFDQNIEEVAFRLELDTDSNGYEHIYWHGIENRESRVFSSDPHTSFWLRFKIGFLGLLPIESQL
jgi:putative cardiolipin synthase